ncbi:hypothetical protein H5410_055044 [Solanum commersonii]|uniref:Uncharacterized protein n=1 Tax=Solanum commersonii TaxID=4109 RepID=A0A9J5WJ73_SOLCO|nr:hypothetical protein H5410_055044 [Solanum commersonii]
MTCHSSIDLIDCWPSHAVLPLCTNLETNDHLDCFGFKNGIPRKANTFGKLKYTLHFNLQLEPIIEESSASRHPTANLPLKFTLGAAAITICADWAPQGGILEHSSIREFVSHCG